MYMYIYIYIYIYMCVCVLASDFHPFVDFTTRHFLVVPKDLGRGLRLRRAQLPLPGAARGAPAALGAEPSGGAAGTGTAAASQRCGHWGLGVRA